MFTHTIQAPVGSPKKYERIIPATRFTTATTADEMTTLRKLLNTRMDVRGGNIIRAEISMAPISLMPSTMVTAVSTESTVL